MSTEDFKQVVTPCGDPFPADSDTQPAPAPTPIDELRDHLAALDLNTGMLAELVEKAQAALAAKDAKIERLNMDNHMLTVRATNAEKCADGRLARAEKAEAELEGTKEALRIAQKERDDHLHGIKRLHELYGEPYYSWQRVFQNTERLLAERDALRAEVDELKSGLSEWTRYKLETDRALAAAQATLREYLPQLAHEWAWKRNSTQANNREMAELDAAIDQARKASG